LSTDGRAKGYGGGPRLLLGGSERFNIANEECEFSFAALALASSAGQR